MSATRQEKASMRHAPRSAHRRRSEAHAWKELGAEENQDLQGSRKFPQEPTRGFIKKVQAKRTRTRT